MSVMQYFRTQELKQYVYVCVKECICMYVE